MTAAAPGKRGFVGRSSREKKRIQKAFLIAYMMNGGRVTAAARSVGISPDHHFKWVTQDNGYIETFNEAQIVAAQVLEDEAIRRAVEGVQEPIVYKGQISKDAEGNPVVVNKYSDSLLALLLKGSNPNKFRERVSAELSGPDGKAIKIDPGRDKLSDEHLQQLIDLAERFGGSDPTAPSS